MYPSELRSYRAYPIPRPTVMTRRCLTRLIAGIGCAVATLACGPDTLVDGDIAFVDVNILPMDREHVLNEQTVIIEGGRIAAMGSSDEIGPEDGVPVIEADGGYLMPGLTEMHAHLPDSRMSDMDIANLLFLYIANGVTTVRGMQGDPSQFGLRNQIERGLRVGPSLYLASVVMSGAAIQTPEGAEQRVREYEVAGYDLVKLTEGLTVEAFDAVARTAVEVGLPFAGHVPDQVGIRHALASGQRSIDHLDNYLQGLVPADQQPDVAPGLAAVGALVDRIDEDLMPDLVRATVDAGTWVVPTMVLWETVYYGDRDSAEIEAERPEVMYMPPEVLEQWRHAVDGRLSATDPASNRQVAGLRRRMLHALYRGGARIALGTDSPQIFSVPGFSIHREMAVYIDVGMTPYDVLEIGTRKPAEYFDATGEFGTVAVGRRADLILLTENPLDDIGHVSRRAGVMLRGRWFSEDEIQGRLQDIARFYGN